uniref:Uncharacterized protein n=1 Tax=Leersia perrieri TaxID=77586 RepID=A0A0D9XRJ1_9ORYZ
MNPPVAASCPVPDIPPMDSVCTSPYIQICALFGWLGCADNAGSQPASQPNRLLVLMKQRKGAGY